MKIETSEQLLELSKLAEIAEDRRDGLSQNELATKYKMDRGKICQAIKRIDELQKSDGEDSYMFMYFEFEESSKRMLQSMLAQYQQSRR